MPIEQILHRSTSSRTAPRRPSPPGESHTIPPGHDASNAGKESVVALEIPSADVFAKPA